MTPNTGKRPHELKDTDKVRGTLRNGKPFGPWTVRNNSQAAINWSFHGDRAHDIIEWELA
jgi:hypothetical protein